MIRYTRHRRGYRFIAEDGRSGYCEKYPPGAETNTPWMAMLDGGREWDRCVTRDGAVGAALAIVTPAPIDSIMSILSGD